MNRKFFNTNERRMVESTIIQLCLISTAGDHLTHSGVDLGKNPLDHPLIGMLTDSGAEIIPAMTVKASKRVFRRVMPMKNLMLDACEASGETPFNKQGLATILFINNLIAQCAFSYAEGSLFEKALNGVVALFQASYENDVLRKSAFKAARRQLATMREHGYFTEVEWILDDD